MKSSKVFNPRDLPESNSSGYPAPFRDGQRKRWNRRLGDYGGLKNYGVYVSSRAASLRPGTPTRNRMNSFTSSKVNSSSSPIRDARLSGRAVASHSRRALETATTF
jgi:hypothetical protein